MFTVTVQTNFLASHQLTLPDGKKENLHSHNWLISAHVSSIQLNKIGLVIDFNRLKKLLDNIVSPISNKTLENYPFFQKNSSSAETVALYIFENLKNFLPAGLTLDSVTVTEEPGFSATYKNT